MEVVEEAVTDFLLEMNVWKLALQIVSASVIIYMSYYSILCPFSAPPDRCWVSHSCMPYLVMGLL